MFYYVRGLTSFTQFMHHSFVSNKCYLQNNYSEIIIDSVCTLEA